MTDLAYLTIAALMRGFEQKSFSPVDVVNAQLDRIHKHNSAINAFSLLDEDGAIRRAKESEERWQRKAPLGILDGVPFTAKDNLMVAGYPWRRGSRATPETKVAESSPIVARCEEAGAVFLGLTCMPEFGVGPVTISPLTGVTTNPWNTTKQAGGSSGGGAAAVAAGFCTLSVASDAGGSIRIPAALTGVVGYKPTGARVPIFPPSVAIGLSCNGPLTRSVEDAALVLGLASRPDSRDSVALLADGTDYVSALRGGVKGWRIGLSTTLGFARKVDPEIVAAVKRAAQVFRDLGAEVEECNPGIEDPIDAFLTLFHGGFRYASRNFDPTQKSLLSPALRAILDMPDVPLNAYLRAQEQSQTLARRMQAFHDEYDLLLTPTVAAPAFDANRTYPEEYEEFSNRRAWTPFCALFNMTQQPAISVPAGLTRAGLPIGLHIVGARGADGKVLRAAHTFEDMLRFSEKPAL
jgi:aspartyl-tRNA(Asn)/glutamyl-tRNA(Gln) amidotransferase subunit A